jgi:hypothetical protein
MTEINDRSGTALAAYIVLAAVAVISFALGAVLF